MIKLEELKKAKEAADHYWMTAERAASYMHTQYTLALQRARNAASAADAAGVRLNQALREVSEVNEVPDAYCTSIGPHGVLCFYTLGHTGHHASKAKTWSDERTVLLPPPVFKELT